MRTLLKWHGRPLVRVADDKLRSYAAASDELGLNEISADRALHAKT